MMYTDEASINSLQDFKYQNWVYNKGLSLLLKYLILFKSILMPIDLKIKSIKLIIDMSVKQRIQDNLKIQKNESIEESLNNLAFKLQIQGFASNLEMGDLGLSSKVDYGYILYGQTRIGKTMNGHALVGNPLIGVKISGEQMVQATTSRNKNAKIGNTILSQTLIPNFFQIKQKGIPKIEGYCCVVDTPGYGDTKGILTILANGYFHYRLYSKVKNMKFLLCFDANQLKNTGQNFVNTIIQWSASFKNYLKVRKDIWKSCIFIINKVDYNSNKQDVLAKLKTIVKDIKTQQETEVQDALKEFINYMIKEDRIQCIKKVKVGQSFVGNGILKRIDSKITDWWSREYYQDTKLVDMKPVQFGLGKSILVQITKNNKSKKQFIELICYYNLRAKQIFNKFKQQQKDKDSGKYSLEQVIKKLVIDAMDLPDSHSFMSPMQSFRQKYYAKYNQAFRDEREKLQKQMFSCKSNDSTVIDKAIAKTRGKDKNYLVKKFQSLKKIQDLKRKVDNPDVPDKRFEWIQQSQQNIIQIIKELSRISFKRNKAPEIIYKYGYLINRIVEESKVFLLLIELCDPLQSKRIKQQTGFAFIDLHQNLSAFVGRQFQYDNQEFTYDQIHAQFVKKFSLDDEKYKDLIISEPLIDFFTQIQINNEEDSEKLVKLILKYSDQFIKESEQKTNFVSNSQTRKLIQQLMNGRINCQKSFYTNTTEQKNQYMLLIRKSTQNLARLLQLLGKYQISRQVYDSIRFVSCVCRLYEVEIEGLKKVINLKDDLKNKSGERKKLFDLYLNYSKYLADHLRDNKAIEILQEAFEIAQDKDELDQIKDEINDLKAQVRDTGYRTKYELELFQEQYFEEFNQEIENRISELVANLTQQ